jgi:ribA/ribD-fused uncharacterized protein
MENKIDSFTGDYDFLSNFYLCEIHYEGSIYPSLEHAYQAAKTFDIYQKAKIRDSYKPGQAKHLGQNVFIRKDWERIKLSIMEDLIRIKFTDHLNLREKLIQTKDAELIEGNYWHDNFYGNCSCSKCFNIIGENHLGKILMKVRQEIEEHLYDF